MQNIAFGRLHIPRHKANQENLNAIVSNNETRKIAKQAFDKINEKTGDRDVFLHITKNDEINLPANNQLAWYTIEVADKNNKPLASEIILKDFSDDGTNGSYTANFKRHMDKLEKCIPQMGKTTTDSFFDIFA